jgi:hypothetical protein
MAEPRIPRIRRAPLPDDALIVVRGDDLDPAASRHQANVFRRRFPDWGRWGLSAFYARSDAEIEDLAADQLERFPLLGCYRVNDLRASGFEIWPTFRTRTSRSPSAVTSTNASLPWYAQLTTFASTRTMRPTTNRRGDPVTATEVDLVVDLNTMDDTGLPWAFLDDAPDATKIRPGHHLLVGSGVARAVALVVDITDGIVHVRPLRGSVSTNAHMLDDPGRLAS